MYLNYYFWSRIIHDSKVIILDSLVYKSKHNVCTLMNSEGTKTHQNRVIMHVFPANKYTNDIPPPLNPFFNIF